MTVVPLASFAVIVSVNGRPAVSVPLFCVTTVKVAAPNATVGGEGIASGLPPTLTVIVTVPKRVERIVPLPRPVAFVVAGLVSVSSPARSPAVDWKDPSVTVVSPAMGFSNWSFTSTAMVETVALSAGTPAGEAVALDFAAAAAAALTTTEAGPFTSMV